MKDKSMKFKYETENERRERLESWTRYFAWLPVDLGNGTVIWLEHYEARRTFKSIYRGLPPEWEYRTINET
jgi:hypothetical protein